MRIALSALVSVTLLSGCLSQQESCIVQARSELNTINRLIATAEGNVARGFALTTVTELRERNTFCTGTNEDGSTFTFPCTETETVEREVPVAIDIAEERRKLAQLRERRAALEPQVAARVAQCQAQFPEG